MKIWERYFLWQMLRTFLFLITGFYILYVIIDYASHVSNVHHNHIHFHWKEILFYYAFEFVQRMDILIPFALLIATIRTLSQLNMHNELVALMASGIHLKKFLRPFIFVGLSFTVLIFIGYELLTPHALKGTKRIDEAHRHQKSKSHQIPSVQHTALEDGSTLLFHHYDTIENYFFDAYWIRSIDEIYRIKILYPNFKGKVIAFHGDHFIRQPHGPLVIRESFTEKELPEIRFNKDRLLDTITLPEEQPLTALWNKLPLEKKLISEKESQILSTFYYKLVLPWFCLLAVIAPAPFCIRFTRALPVFFIYACSIFSLVAFYLLMDAALVLGERQVLPPILAIGVPFFSISSIFVGRFFLLR